MLVADRFGAIGLGLIVLVAHVALPRDGAPRVDGDLNTSGTRYNAFIHMSSLSRQWEFPASGLQAATASGGKATS